VSNPISVAVLGFWHVHAAEYTARIQQHPDTELVGIWDDDPVRGRAAAENANTAFVEDLDQLLARDDVDAVGVTTATRAHHTVMLRAVEAGKHTRLSHGREPICWLLQPSKTRRNRRTKHFGGFVIGRTSAPHDVAVGAYQHCAVTG
jgi:Oxidoreductase family, NAD-binding Rossmann fold